MGFNEVLGLATANVIWATQTGMIITTGGIGYLFLMAAGFNKRRTQGESSTESAA